MDLNARAVSDSQKIHNNTLGAGGFAIDVKFTDREATPNSLTIKALYTDVSLTVDPDTGMIMASSKIAISFHQSDLTIWDGKADIQLWKVEFTNGAGQSISAQINQVLPDRTFGDVVVLCKIIAGH